MVKNDGTADSKERRSGGITATDGGASVGWAERASEQRGGRGVRWHLEHLECSH